MRVACDEAEAQLKLTDDASRTLLERASNLRDERCVVAISTADYVLTRSQE